MYTNFYKCPVCKQWYDGELCENCDYENTHKELKKKERRNAKDERCERSDDSRKVNKRPRP